MNERTKDQGQKNVSEVPEMSFVAWDPVQHAQLVQNWWRGHGMEPVPQRLIPCYGAIAFERDSGTPRLAGWYAHDPINQTAFLTWVVGNPDPGKRASARIGKALFQELNRCALSQGAIALFCYCEGRMARVAEKAGYLKIDQGLEMLVHPLGAWN